MKNNTSALKCLLCNGATMVTNSRPSGAMTRRRRECIVCKNRFTTYETYAFTRIDKDTDIPIALALLDVVRKAVDSRILD
jgi:hypothetical protein